MSKAPTHCCSERRVEEEDGLRAHESRCILRLVMSHMRSTWKSTGRRRCRHFLAQQPCTSRWMLDLSLPLSLPCPSPSPLCFLALCRPVEVVMEAGGGEVKAKQVDVLELLELLAVLAAQGL